MSKVDTAILEAIGIINSAREPDQQITYDVHKIVDKSPFVKGVNEIISINIRLTTPV